jgi:hypothetical protein
MKTIQIFNFNRFGKYAKSTIAITYKQNLLAWGALVTFIFLASLIAMADNSSNWNRDGWIPLFLGIYFIAGIIYAGVSFAPFRSKEKTIMSLMMPVTPFERLLYEFLEKVVVYIILLPIVFYLFSTFALVFRNIFEPHQMVTVNGINSFPFKPVSWSTLIKASDGFFAAFFSLSVFLFSLSFTGAATFRKYPLIKTVVFVGVVLAVIAGYFVLIFQKLQLQNPWLESIGDHWSKEQGVTLMVSLAVVASLITLAFAYFKLKEKEAQ